MKKGDIFITLIVCFVFLSVSVKADITCSDPNQIIMKLYSLNNTHGEEWNGTGNYPIQICYDNIFGTKYLGANPHDCTGSNTILSLYSSTNSHAKVNAVINVEPFNDASSVDICYGNIVCILSSTTCDSNYPNEIVALEGSLPSLPFNMHLAYNSSYNSIFSYRICCSSSGPVAKITTPQDRQIYYIGTTINFNQLTHNPNYIYNWTILGNDGNLIYYSNSNSFNYNFPVNDEGMISVILTVYDSSKNILGTDQTDILLVGSPGIFGRITKPGANENIYNDTLEADYEADGYVINSSADSNCNGPTKPCLLNGNTDITSGNFCVECLTGPCPPTTKNAPNACTGANANLTVKNPVQDYSNVMFTWTFSDGSQSGDLQSFSQMGKFNGIHKFASQSNIPLDKWIKMIMNYTLNGISLQVSKTRFFTLYGNGPTPAVTGAEWLNNSGTAYVANFNDDPSLTLRGDLSNVASGTPMIINIYDSDVLAVSDPDSLTPLEHIDGTSLGSEIKVTRTLSNLISGGSVRIGHNYTFIVKSSSFSGSMRSNRLQISNLVNPGDCSQITDSNICNQSLIRELSGFVLDTSCGYDRLVHKCIWNISDSPKCTNGWQFYDRKGAENGTCNYVVSGSNGECDPDGYRNVSVRSWAECNGNCNVCNGGVCRVPCARSIASLAFFGVMQLVETLIVIGLIYFAIFQYKKKNKSKR